MSGSDNFQQPISTQPLKTGAIAPDGGAMWRRIRKALRAEQARCKLAERNLSLALQEHRQLQQIVKGAATRVMEEQERTVEILSALGQGLFELDGSGCVQFLNAACERKTGWSMSKLHGVQLHDLLHPPHHRTQPCTPESCALLNVQIHDSPRRVEHDIFYRQDGSPIPVAYFCTPIHRGGRQIGSVICFDDISERLAAAQVLDDYARRVKRQNEQLYSYCEELTLSKRQLEQQAEELRMKNAQILEANHFLMDLATTDGMTGIANHRAFQEAIRTVWNAGRQQSGAQLVSIMMVDVDNFKSYNDAFGHPAGDAVLKSVANLMRTHVRESDLVARYGGEEFIVLAWDADHSSALRSAQRLCRTVAEHDFAGSSVTISIGVATRDTRGVGDSSIANVYETPDDLIKAADDALYDAKRSGRNCVRSAEMLPLVV